MEGSLKGEPQSQRREGGGGELFMGEMTTQVFYQNYLPISASFSLKRVI